MLEFPATGSWNGHHQQFVVLECGSYALVPVTLRLTMRDAGGGDFAVHPLVVEPLGVTHVVLNDFGISDAYGTFLLELLTAEGTDKIACIVSTYRLSSGGAKAVDYAFAMRVENPTVGEVSGIFNSYNPEGAVSPVFNWLSVINPGGSPFVADIDVFDGAGGLLNSFPIAVPGKGKVDVGLGHNEPLNGGQLFGLYRIRPQNPTAPYLAHLARYLNPAPGIVDFAFTLRPREGGCGPEPVFLSTMNPATNWLEVANAGTGSEMVTVSIHDQASNLLHEENLMLPALAQQHLNINQYLGESAIGFATVSCAGGDSVPLHVQSSHYGHPTSNSPEVIWAYASQRNDIQAEAGERLVGFVNTFLGMNNWLKLSGAVDDDSRTYLDIFNDVGARVDKDDYRVDSHTIFDIPLHESFDPDKIGLAVLQPARSGNPVVGEVLRVFPLNGSGIGSIMRAPAGVVRADDLRVGAELLTDAVENPTFVGNAADSSGRLFIVERDGRIMIHDGSNLLGTPFLDIVSQVSNTSERGLHSFAFHPEFTSNDRVFVMYTNLDGDSVVSEFAVSGGDANQLDPTSERIILTVDQPAGNHNGGQLQFGPDGYLYISLGDGGGANDVFENGQNLGTLLGSLLRIDVDGALPYEVPADNPFVGVAGAQPEIWAYGLRNPWRFSFDMASGRMIVPDVGQGLWEEINIVTRGGNYGWNIMEGLHCFEPAEGCDPTGLELPVYEYSHDDGTAIIGGYVYRGSAMPNLVGSYVFADFSSGKVWALQESSSGTWIRQTIYEGSFLGSAIGEDESGELYLADFLGNIYRLTPPT